jgi:hypothetical protein
VDVEQSRNLKTLFDAGLRPIHFNGLEASKLEFETTMELSFVLAGVTTPTLTGSWFIDVYEDGSIAGIEGYPQEPLSRDQAYNELVKWELAFGFKDDLPKLRQWVDEFPQPTGGPDLWGRKIFRNIPGVNRKLHYYLRHSFQEGKPFLITFEIEFIRTGRHDTIFGSEPLRAPPGYEDHDMRSLEKRAADTDSLEREAQQALAAKEVSVPKPPLSQPKAEPPPASNWWKWLLVVLAVLSLARHVQKSARNA